MRNLILIIFLCLSIASCDSEVIPTSANCYTCEAPKYEEYFSYISSHELLMYYDYEQGLRCAKAQNKPIFLTFTGHGAVACRENTFEYWLKDESIFNTLRNNYVIVALFVDDKSPLDSSEFYFSENFESKITTIGFKNADYQRSRYNKNSQPMSIVLDSNGDDLLEPLYFESNYGNISKYMQRGLVEFNNPTCNNNTAILIALFCTLIICIITILILINYIKRRL